MPIVDGRCDSRFRLVREVFVDVVAAGRAGSAVAIWHDGHMVVDLWGGRTTLSAGRWARDALVMPYSVSKPFSAVCALLLVEQGLLALDAPGRCYLAGVGCDATVRRILDVWAVLPCATAAD